VSPISSSARPMARTGQHVQYSVCTVQCENVLPSGRRLERRGYFTGKEKEGKGKERKGRMESERKGRKEGRKGLKRKEKERK
jgi:hypothetical protein